jgi:hypothetical protein
MVFFLTIASMVFTLSVYRSLVLPKDFGLNVTVKSGRSPIRSSFLTILTLYMEKLRFRATDLSVIFGRDIKVGFLKQHHFS